MQPGAVGEPTIRERARVVQALPAEGGESYRQDANRPHVAEIERAQTEPRASVHPDVARAVDQDVGDLRVLDQVLQRPRTPDVGAHLSLIHISEPTRLGMISYA